MTELMSQKVLMSLTTRVRVLSAIAGVSRLSAITGTFFVIKITKKACKKPLDQHKEKRNNKKSAKKSIPKHV